jgi:hypothetical protein
MSTEALADSPSCAVLGDSFVERLRHQVGRNWFVAGRQIELFGYLGKTGFSAGPAGKDAPACVRIQLCCIVGG